MSHILTEISDLALSLKADADTIYSATASFAPLSKRADAVIRAGAIRSKSRRLRKLLVELVAIQTREAIAEERRKAALEPGCVNAVRAPEMAAA